MKIKLQTLNLETRLSEGADERCDLNVGRGASGETLLDVGQAYHQLNNDDVGPVDAQNRAVESSHEVLHRVALDLVESSDVLHAGLERLLHEALQQVADLGGFRQPGSGEDGVAVDLGAGPRAERHGSDLEAVEHAAHVALPDLRQGVQGAVGKLQALHGGNLGGATLDDLGLEGRKAEPGAARLNGGNDTIHEVANQAKANVGRVDFHDATKRVLSGVGHLVSFVQNDELQSGAEAGLAPDDAAGEGVGGLGEGLYLLAHSVDAPLVGGVELHHVGVAVRAVEIPGDGHDRGGLPGAYTSWRVDGRTYRAVRGRGGAAAGPSR
ncbi:TonB-dependent receptor [Babesia caballi]|uniref:TonB-dependent receptor n=1 Tax=Babesia caballi TaxID=5871 RepID=A0AAV4LXP8_BABCB|nr:TonB-dependent receptor [Babesia caballi]